MSNSIEGLDFALSKVYVGHWFETREGGVVQLLGIRVLNEDVNNPCIVVWDSAKYGNLTTCTDGGYYNYDSKNVLDIVKYHGVEDPRNKLRLEVGKRYETVMTNVMLVVSEEKCDSNLKLSTYYCVELYGTGRAANAVYQFSSNGSCTSAGTYSHSGHLVKEVT